MQVREKGKDEYEHTGFPDVDGHVDRRGERGISRLLFLHVMQMNYMFTFFLTWPSLTQRAAIIHSY